MQTLWVLTTFKKRPNFWGKERYLVAFWRILGKIEGEGLSEHMCLKLNADLNAVNKFCLKHLKKIVATLFRGAHILLCFG